ncbi:MAG: hypothetical protein M9944_21395 [Rhizobiaceae bacterium]|nr:hypothetical protein [Rhizobiaceae bacterium]
MPADRSRVLRVAKARLDQWMREMISDGTIRPSDPKLTSAAIFGALNWIPFWKHKDSAVTASDIRDEFTVLIDGALRKR